VLLSARFTTGEGWHPGELGRRLHYQRLVSSAQPNSKKDKMRLSSFIRQKSESIIAEWENFARTLVPASSDMSPLSLRNHISYILAFIADDIDSLQTDAEQFTKSRGEKPKASSNSVAETHAALRQAGGFNLDQMVSEYRALRASVIKLWGAQASEPVAESIADLIRFNEAIDQELTESISYYSKQVDHSRNLFLGILGHDLRNPIGAILMSAQLIAKIGLLNDKQGMLISQIETSSGRATSMLDQLLDLTRARLGAGMQIIREPMDMAFVSRQLTDEMRVLHPERTFALHSSGNTEGTWDRPRIGQVFSNLLGNAVQYGFKDLPIEVTVGGEPGEVTLSVHNHGVPIPKEEIGNIFEALIRGGSDSSDQSDSPNLGLGLYITKEIVSVHGGRIQVTSTEKDGTTFTVHLPRSTEATLSEQEVTDNKAATVS
jgi:signal transduction histidine kinase